MSGLVECLAKMDENEKSELVMMQKWRGIQRMILMQMSIRHRSQTIHQISDEKK